MMMITVVRKKRNNKYEKQTTYNKIFSPHDDRFAVPVPEQQPWNHEYTDFANFTKLPKKHKLLEKFEFQDKSRFKLTEMRRVDFCSLPNPCS